MELYKIVLKLKDEPCYKTMRNYLDDFYQSPDFLKVQRLLQVFCSNLLILCLYNKVTSQDCEFAYSMMQKSIETRFAGYYLSVRNVSLDNAPAGEVKKKSYSNILFLLLFLVILGVTVLFIVFPEYWQVCLDFYKGLF